MTPYDRIIEEALKPLNFQIVVIIGIYQHQAFKVFRQIISFATVVEKKKLPSFKLIRGMRACSMAHQQL